MNSAPCAYGLIKSETLLFWRYTNTWGTSDLNVWNRRGTGHSSLRNGLCVKPFPDTVGNKKRRISRGEWVSDEECCCDPPPWKPHLIPPSGKGTVLFPCVTKNSDMQVLGAVWERLESKQQFFECSYKMYVSIELCLLFRRLKASKYGDCTEFPLHGLERHTFTCCRISL